MHYKGGSSVLAVGQILGEYKAKENVLKSAALLREQIEISLSSRAPLALTPLTRAQPEQTPCGIGTIDELLEGGLSAGVLTEFVGAACSGRTTTALAYVATITQAGCVCAWIDAADALDPESAAVSGVDLERLLWVRCGTGSQQLNDSIPKASVTVPGAVKDGSKPSHPGGGTHFRSEGQNMPEAISALMHTHAGIYDKQIRREKKTLGTPGMPNRPLSGRSLGRQEQVNSDRLPPRRGDNLSIASRCAELQARRAASLSSGKPIPLNIARAARMVPEKPWKTLDQALRVADLLLQSGGFSLIVLDLANTSPEVACRIPLATWFRFRAACERTRASLVLLTQHPCAGTSAELVVRLQTGTLEDENTVMSGITYNAAIERSRSHEFASLIVPIRKPPQRAGQWKSEAAWARSK